MKIEYESGWDPTGETRAVIAQADSIADEYASAGYGLTLRQMYYQFVSRDLIPNNDRSYKRLGNIVSRARLSGLIDWSHLTDRTRNPNLVYTGEPPLVGDVIRQAKYGYVTDKWADQEVRVEVWVEKEALGEVVQRAASRLACASLACKGYMSQSEMWEAGQRFGQYIEAGQRVVVLHLGDHDPSGIDMTRDIRDRLETFVYGDWAHEKFGTPPAATGWYLDEERPNEWDRDMFAEEISNENNWVDRPIEVERIALNWDQIRRYNPPPNPAKLSDARGSKYVEIYGPESWELDALPPDVLDTLIQTSIREHLDADKFNRQVDLQTQTRQFIDDAATEIAARFDNRLGGGR